MQYAEHLLRTGAYPALGGEVMNVYIVVDYHPDGSSEILGAFASYRGAEKAIRNRGNDATEAGVAWANGTIEPWEVEP